MIATLIALVLTALAAPAIISWLGRRGFYLLAAAPAAAMVGVIVEWPRAGGSPRLESIHWVPALHMDIDLRMDTLSAIMSILVLGVGALVLCYCAEYFDNDDSPSGPRIRRRVAGFGAQMVAFTGAMFGLVVSDNMIVLYIFWEATTVLSFLLVGFYAQRATSRRAATQALLVTTAGGLAMLAGIVILGERAGSYLLSDVIANPRPAPRSPSRSCSSSSAPSANRRSSRSTSGCPAPWPHPHPSAPICTPRRW